MTTDKGGRPPKFETEEQLKGLIDSYFEEGGPAYILSDEIPMYAPTISGLARHLGVATETLRRYGNDDRFCATVKDAKARVEEYLEQRLYGNAVTGTIFNLKNNFGWKDKTETEHSGKVDGDHNISWTIQPVKPVDETDA